MKTVRVALKSLREILREPQLLGLTLLLPVVFVGLVAASYGGSLLPTYEVWVLDRTAEAGQLVERLADQHYADGRPVFSIRQVQDRAAADEALKSGAATMLLIIEPAGAPGPMPVQLRVVGDALSGRFYRASTLMDEYIRQFSRELLGLPARVRVVERNLAGPATTGGPQTEFDLYASGMIVFALLMIIPQTAMLVAREIRRGTLRRLQIAQVSSSEFLGGVAVAQMVVALAQVLLVFVAALAMGFHSQGALWLAVLVGLAISLSAIGLGLVVASFSENDSQAANVGSTVAMLQVFLSGSFYQLPPLTLFTIAGHQIDLFDVFPATHGFSALQQVLVYGADLSRIAFRISAALLLSLVYLGIGVWLFERRQMRGRAGTPGSAFHTRATAHDLTVGEGQ